MDGIESLLQDQQLLLLEVGPGTALGSFVKQHPACSSERAAMVLSTCPTHMTRSRPTPPTYYTGRLWLAGVTINWGGF